MLHYKGGAVVKFEDTMHLSVSRYLKVGILKEFKNQHVLHMSPYPLPVLPFSVLI